MSLSRLKDVDRCRQIFLGGAYRDCVLLIVGLIEEHPSIALLQCGLISLQRLQLNQEAKDFGNACVRIVTANPFDLELIRLTLGQTSREEVLNTASSELECCQTYYYSGARYLTIGDVNSALREFDLCLALGLECHEALCAEFERRRIPSADSSVDGLGITDLRRLEELDIRFYTLCSERRHREALELAGELETLLHRRYGEEHRTFAKFLNNISVCCLEVADIQHAVSFAERACAIYERVAPHHSDYSVALNTLGGQYLASGRLSDADKSFRRALELHRQASGDGDPIVGTMLNNIGVLYFDLGLYERAAGLLKQAVEHRRTCLGLRHPLYAQSLSSLAGVYARLGEGRLAFDFAKEAYDIRRAQLGLNHPECARSALQASGLCIDLGEYRVAIEILENAEEAFRVNFGRDHFESAARLAKLAVAHFLLGQPAASLSLFSEALEISERVLGVKHRQTASILFNLACVRVALGHDEDAFKLLVQHATLQGDFVSEVFSLASESERLSYVIEIRNELDLFLLLAWRNASKLPEISKVALNLVLRRKGMTAEALALQQDSVLGGRYPQLLPEFEKLRNLRWQIARETGHIIAGRDHKDLVPLIQQWNNEKAQVEASLARQVPEIAMQVHFTRTDINSVANALPHGTVLVEYVRFGCVDLVTRQRAGSRYLAFLLRGRRGGDHSVAQSDISMIDLGDADQIDGLVASYRRTIAGEMEEPEPTNVGVVLRRAIWDPVMAEADGVRKVLLGPDGHLSLLPYETLPSSTGGYLLDDYEISYVSSGRDIVRFGSALGVAVGPSVVVADPEFELKMPESGPSTSVLIPPVSRSSVHGKSSSIDAERQRCNLSETGLHFGRLEGTIEEGQAVARVLGVVPWLGKDALETRLKLLRSPLVLHLATHGYFLADPDVDLHYQSLTFGASSLRTELPLIQNPLLRAGLALAGAQTWISGGMPPPEAEDGLLTAEDVCGMNLMGTELVVLSACDTGIGTIQSGEGIFGLRRAFVIAGVRTLVMSLWKVSDVVTREFMEILYGRLSKGFGKAEAVRYAQKKIRSRYKDPYYWGAFICQGDVNKIGGLEGSSP